MKPPASSDWCFMSARELVALMGSRQVSAREVMEAHLRRIDRLNPTINALVAKLDDSRCLTLADDADRRLAAGADVGPLHGLPWAFKDLEPAVGFPCTNGSPIFRSMMPAQDSVIVERIRAAGAIPIAKTNVPEFGMGSHTYNRVYGVTRNPYDTTKSAGGSSGGAAAALAAGLLPLADGSDLGGSLRNPASFNNIVGFRPTVGLVPTAPTLSPVPGVGVKGPLGRSVRDVAWLLSVMAGPDERDDGTYPSEPSLFLGDLSRDVRGTRVAWCPNLGSLPLDRSVREVIDAQRQIFAHLGCVVEDVCPDFTDADKAFVIMRQWRSWVLYGDLLKTNREDLKPEAIWEIEAGRALSKADVNGALKKHSEFRQRLHTFQAEYEYLVCAVSQVPPFDASLDWPRTIEGVQMDSYISWMKSAYWISMTSGPAISVPAGFTDGGLPVGLQLVGQPRADFALLQLAHAFEQATNVGAQRPSIAL